MSDAVMIRDGRPAEREELEALQRRSSLVWADTRAALEAHPESICVDPAWFEAGSVRVATADARICGFSVVLGTELDGLFVEPENFRRGIGLALVEDAAARAPGDLTVVATRNALGFYEKVGFEAVRDVRTEFAPALLMRRRG